MAPPSIAQTPLSLWFWTVLFFLTVGTRLWLPPPFGELVCVLFLVVGTTVAFTCWKGPERANGAATGSNRSSRDENSDVVELQRPDSGYENKNATSASDKRDPTADTDRNDATATSANDTNANGITTLAGARGAANARTPFLDNLKTFLTSLVVTHHVACAFGGCGEGTWYLIVGSDGPPAFQAFVETLVVLNQSFFMSLFFFISAYFVPSSYARAGGWGTFRKVKRRRILVPALFVFFFVSPVAIVMAGNLVYYPNPGPAWFLFWLLLFNLVYVSLSAKDISRGFASSSHDGLGSMEVGQDHGTSAGIQNEASIEPLNRGQIKTPHLDVGGEAAITPRSTSSLCDELRSMEVGQDHGTSAGIRNEAFVEPLIHVEIETPNPNVGGEAAVVTEAPAFFPSTCSRIACGVVICGLSLMPFLILELGTFASMPLAVGSWTCDFFMFYLGLRANKHRWFDRPLREQLDIHPLVLACFVVIEGVAIALTRTNIEVWWPLLVIVAGMFCLDASLLLLLVFQQWANFETKLTRSLARGAYGVYLLHPIVVTGTTAFYLRICDGLGGAAGREGAYFYPLGFVFVDVASHAINCPLAYFLAQLPYLKTIL